MKKAIFMSNNNKWGTPIEFFNKLNKEFNFTLDPCCEKHTAKCVKYYTEKENGLMQSWENEIVFCNPPYGKDLPIWIEKCCIEASKPNTKVVMLIPARTDTIYFHKFLYDQTTWKSKKRC